MLIYRYEDKDGAGPVHCAADIMSAWNHLPIPREDGIEGWGWSFHCGCKCRRTLREWFDAWMRHEVKRRGLTLTIYEVPDHLVKVGGFQVMFDPAHATSVRKKKQSGTFASTDQGRARV